MSEHVSQGAAESEAPNAEARSLRTLITPARERFVRCHFAVPSLSPEEPLEIGGAVFEPRTLRPRDLRALAPVALTVTTECAGNGRTSIQPLPPGEPWNRGAVSTAQWTGVPLRNLVKPRETAVELVFTGADGGRYQRSLPLEAALDPATIVAWEMNGAPIPPLFGGPLRLIVPGWYGMASVKWLARIEAVEAPFAGEFQTEKYVYRPGEPVARMRPRALFTEVPDAVRAGEPVRVAGLAWSGAVLRRVQIGAGDDVLEARLLGPPLPFAWRRFEARVTFSGRGRARLWCRAFDAHGAQPGKSEWNALGYGGNGVQSIELRVR